MANNYFNFNQPVVPGTRIVSARYNQDLSSIAAAFDILPGSDDLFLSLIGYGVAGGTVPNVYNVTIPVGSPLVGYVTGMQVTFLADKTSTGAAQLNVNGLGNKLIVSSGNVGLPAGSIIAGSYYTLRYDGTNFQMQTALYALFDQAAQQAASSAAAALASQQAAATSATNASNSASSAAGSKTAAATSEANAATYASQALGYRNTAQSAATTATTQATNASNSASAAATSESNALAYRNTAQTAATNASNSASAASTSATNAANSATAAANSAASISLPLPVSSGGTGATSVAAARTALSLDKFQQFTNDTRMVDPSGNRYLFVGDRAANPDWGVFDMTNNAKVALPLASGGTGAVTATAARTNLGLGALATLSTIGKNQLDSDLARGTFFANGRTGKGAGVSTYSNTDFGFNEQFATLIQVSNQNDSNNNNGSGIWQHYLALGTNGNVIYARNINGVYGSDRMWSTRNTTVDGSGFIKQASPVIRVVSDPNDMSANFTEGFIVSGHGAVNEEAEGVSIARISAGVYKITGATGLHDDGWQVEVPKDVNGNRLCFINTSVSSDGEITLKVFRPKLDLETGGIVAGAAIDIPTGRWIDLRLNMPEDSVYNLRQKEILAQMTADKKSAEE